MKIGIVGCGGMGTTHYLSLKALAEKEDIEVAALADCRKEFLDKAAAYFPEAAAYEYGMDLIEKEDLDVVHICLPSYLHTEHAVAAMERGMDVFIEKPVCLTREDGAKLLEVQKRTGKNVIVGQVVRFTEEYQYLKEVYDSGKYGKLNSIVMNRVAGDVNWGFEDWFHDETRSGSVVLDLHVHDVDYLRYLLGEPENFNVKATAFPSGMVNQIVTTYDFGNTFAEAEGCWNVSTAVEFRASYRASFDEALVDYDGARTPSLIVYKKDGTKEVPELVKGYEAQSDAAGINISNLGPYYNEIRYFIECVKNNRLVETAPLVEGVKSAELAIREWEAAKAYIAGRKTE